MTMRRLFDTALTLLFYILVFGAAANFVLAYDLHHSHPFLVFFAGSFFGYQLFSLIPLAVVVINDRLLGERDE